MLKSIKPVILAGLLAGACLPGPPARGEGTPAKSCLSSPRATAPSGMHWYYHRDSKTNRLCWYLAPPDSKVHAHAAASKPMSASSVLAHPAKSKAVAAAMPETKVRDAKAVSDAGHDPSDRPTPNNPPANSNFTPTIIAAAADAEPAASARKASLSPGQAQQALLVPNSDPFGQDLNSTVRGMTDNEIRFGISAPFSGTAKELGQNMRMGIEAAFDVANANGGVNGRQLRLIAADNGDEPTQAAATMEQLYEEDQVFGLVGNVGTPAAVVALPYALERKMLFFGAFTGAGLLRSEPPDRYVFRYRASCAEETAALVSYLVKVRRLKPEQIAVFAQQDAYGDACVAGVTKAVRLLGEGNESTILRLNYQRNTVDVDDAVEQLGKSRIPIKAVIMIPTYRAAAKFIEKTRERYPNMIYTSVSFVGATALANELMLLGKEFANGVIVTQVVPAVDGHSSLLPWRNAGLCFARRLRRRQRADRCFETDWPKAQHRKTDRSSGKSP